MALTRRHRLSMDIWPGFVDALATLLMVIIFLLMIFVVSQLYLNEALVGRDQALDRLNTRVSELSDMLALERETNLDLRGEIDFAAAELRASLARSDELADTLERLRGSNLVLADEAAENAAALAEAEAEKLRVAAALEDAFKQVSADREKITMQLQEIALLEQNVRALQALEAELKDAAAAKDLALDEERERLLTARAESALLNRQLRELTRQISVLGQLLAESEERDSEAQAQIADLGRRLNVALAGKVSELARYRSEFFGRLRDILGSRAGVQVVGDRFVFQSEVLFDPGSAELGPAGRFELARLAESLRAIAAEIPDSINWILQVNGHSDRIPIFNERFPSNWELSAARAISVVRYLISLGIPPERLAATGFGEFQPLDAADTPEALARNRRIELKLTQR